jgi:hypothetical protein
MPTQTIHFRRDQYAEIARRAEEEDKSLSETTREIIDAGLGTDVDKESIYIPAGDDRRQIVDKLDEYDVEPLQVDEESGEIGVDGVELIYAMAEKHDDGDIKRVADAYKQAEEEVCK